MSRQKFKDAAFQRQYQVGNRMLIPFKLLTVSNVVYRGQGSNINTKCRNKKRIKDSLFETYLRDLKLIGEIQKTKTCKKRCFFREDCPNKTLIEFSEEAFAVNDIAEVTKITLWKPYIIGICPFTLKQDPNIQYSYNLNFSLEKADTQLLLFGML